MRIDEKIPQYLDPLKIRVETRREQMRLFIERIRDDRIELLHNKFRRRPDIWSDGRQSRLIESMLVQIPLLDFYVDASNNDRWFVIDGFQRLTTIKRFVIEQSFSLSSLEFLMECQGKKFSELSRSFQRRIEETDIVIHRIEAGIPDNVRNAIIRRIILSD